MHPEIEKLIDLAIADGQITDKERNVIIKKATDLGVDVDEVEMVLDGKLHQMEANKPKQKEKVGNIKTCPACGASVKAMEAVCVECAHEFSNIKANSTILDLIAKIDKIETEKNKTLATLKSTEKFIEGQNFEERKKELIRNYPVPNTKEDIFEFLTYSTSKLTNVSSLDNPWASKADEIIMKSRFLFKNDPSILANLEKYEKEIKKRKKGPIVIIVISMLLIILMAALVLIFGDNLLKK